MHIRTNLNRPLSGLLIWGALVTAACSSPEVAVLVTDSPALVFSDVDLGDSASLTLTLRNDGTRAVTLADAALSGDDAAAFAVLTPLAGTELGGGASVAIEVQFSPATEGSLEALLTLGSSGPSLSGGVDSSAAATLFPARVTLLGTGVAPGDDDSAGDDDTGDDDTGDDDTGDDDTGDDDTGDDDTGDDDTGDDDTGDDDTSGNDLDGDGFIDAASGGNDCDDSDPSLSPAAVEFCDGVDNNCSGTADENPVDGSSWHLDSDGDGYGGQLLTEFACEAPTGFVDNADDCNDLDADIAPGEDEVCNGNDDDCDGQVDEESTDASTWYLDADQDGYGGTFLSQQTCTAPSGYVASADDCDDLRDATYPGAAELCDGEDNDCDTLIDEGVGSSWYLDGDGDGYGISGTTQVSCDPPTGYAPQDGDCDDTDPGTHPGATELCDGFDRNCDGTAGITTWYQDSDGDGYGTTGTTTAACASPPGFSGNSGDCDDTVAATNPGSYEICDGVDNNCDSVIDDANSLNAATWFEDLDADGYGSSATSVSACDQPSGFADNAGDCNDAVGSGAAINPGASEICDGIDNDCDGAIDEDAIDATAWYPDSDGDGEGDDSSAGVLACSAPSGHVANQDDCDDGDDSIGAGAEETCDGIDNDCDGIVDISGGADLCLYGDGRDGTVVITGSATNYNSNVLGSSRVGVADGIQTPVTADPSSATLQVGSSSGFAAGDLALLVNLQGAPGDVDDVGNWEVVAILAAPDSITVQLLAPPGASYDGNSFASQSVVLQRLPQWSNVTIQSGGSLVASPWDGTTGGLLAFLVSGTLNVVSGGAITMSERGYRGGTGNQENGPGSWSSDGEGRTGTGSASDENPNDNGGGGAFSFSTLINANAGGGAYGSRDPGPFGNQGGSSVSGLSGNVIGDSALSQINFGGGGGGCTNQAVVGSDGGDGGGIVFVRASTMAISGAIRSDGQNGFVCGSSGPGSTSGDPSNASGGAGGAIYLVAETLTSGSIHVVTALGGTAASNGNNGQGAAGGNGRIRLEYGSVDGNVFPATSDAHNVAEPDPSESLPGG